MMSKFLIASILSLIIIVIGCSGDVTILKPSQPDIQGVWEEEFALFSYTDPIGEIDSVGGIIYKNSSDFDTLKMISRFHFISDSFNLKITDLNGRVSKEMAGTFRAVGDTLEFYVTYQWSYYWSRFYPAYNEIEPYTQSLLYKLQDDNSLELSTVPYTDENGAEIYILINGFPWAVPEYMFAFKNSGVFTRQ